MTNRENEIVVYQSENGSIQLNIDKEYETFWIDQKQISEIFGIDRTVVTKHINNILKDKEIPENSNVQKMHISGSDKPVKYYSLDIVLAVGYRAKSSKAIKFRQWATQTLKQHITQGFTINPDRIEKNYQKFMEAVENVQKLTQNTQNIKTEDALELIKTFAYTWFSLDSFDKGTIPKSGNTQKSIKIHSDKLYEDIQVFKKELISKNEATELFAQESKKGNLEGIFTNVFQSVFGEDVYPTIEEKAAHLLYFIVKNHPFNDGNKRTGAFAFIRFLRKTGFDFAEKISPHSLTVLTLLVAESNPKDKEKIVGIILLLLNDK